MLDYLIERDQEEGLRTTTRSFTFPGGETHRITTYRLVWRWYDNLIAYEFGHDENYILTCTQRCAAEEGHDDLGTALGVVVAYLCQVTEQQVGDITDDNIALMLAQKAGQKWTARHCGKR